MNKKIVIAGVLAIGILLAGEAAAQSGRVKQQQNTYDPGVEPEGLEKNKVSPRQVAEMKTRGMKRELHLTKEQEKKVEEINLRYALEIDEQIRNSPDMTDYDKAMIAGMWRRYDEELKTALTEEQWFSYQKKIREKGGF
jgi:hypothetical protein